MLLSLIIVFMAACGGNESSRPESTVNDSNDERISNSGGADVSKYDPNRGEGKFANVDVGNKLVGGFR